MTKHHKPRKAKPASQRITRARAALMIFQPFYGTILYNLAMEESRSFPTMATNGCKIFYNPDFVDGLTDDELLFVLSHEAAHCANKHHFRRGIRDPKLWNKSGDYVINADLLTAGIGVMPKDGLINHKFQGLSAEDIYSLLKQEQEQEQNKQPSPQDGPTGQVGAEQGSDPGEGEPGPSDAPSDPQGQGESQDQDQGESQGEGEGEGGEGEDEGEGEGQSTGCGDPGGCGEILDAPGDATEIAKQDANWETVIRQAVNVATKQVGSVPAHLQRLVTEINEPKTDWRAALRRFIEQSNRFDYSWQRTDRRFATADYLMPGTIPDGINHIVVAVDTSGSLYCEAPQKRFASEIQALLDEQVVDKITLLDCDARINNVQTFETGDIVTFTNRGGGGTSFQPVWEWLKTNQEDTAAVVYFTDLEPCDGWGKEPALPVMWAAYGHPSRVRMQIASVPFGECIEIAE